MRNKPSYRMKYRSIGALIIVGVLASCALYAKQELSERYGAAEPRQRMAPADSERGQFYHQQVQPILDKRCVVCHGCYDAPCQLKLSSAQGVDRGASKQIIYDGTRLLKAEPSRLFFDHDTTTEWRADGFHPVLNEREQTPTANQQAGVMARLLTLKQQQPLPAGKILPASFDFSLNRDQQCPKPEELNHFERNFPSWGMPYGLPGLSQSEQQTLQTWLKQGASTAPLPSLGSAHTQQVAAWETFLNGDSLKQQLVSRYLYEHWFLAHVYFSNLPAGEFFRVVRSRTPPGKPIDIISTRRPYDDPGVDRVYYRLWRERGTILEKTHMPYALNAARLKKYKQLFLQAEYEVKNLPSYAARVAANPFVAFAAIPGVARYKFLLEEAQFTIMNYIKGPVCRGQVALDVINDQFWVFFVEPWKETEVGSFKFYAEQQDNLALPDIAGSNALVLTNWWKYSKRHSKYLQAKASRMNEQFPSGKHLSTDAVWDGDGDNQNAALTIFRHFDTASVVKGLVGHPPKTAWIIDYSLLERIHYLLVAGFDVYGNVGHQFNTRIYMDFLRMEGEFNFLSLLPSATRLTELQDWYQGVSSRQLEYLMKPYQLFLQPSGIKYQTDQPKKELYGMLQQHLAAVLPKEYKVDHQSVPAAHRRALNQLRNVKGGPATLLSQVTLVTVHDDAGDGDRHYTLLHNNAHSNITSLLDEQKNRLPSQDTITVVNGFIGAYPETFMQVDAAQLDNYVKSLLAMTTAADYDKLMDRFGMRRTDPDFWQHSDRVQTSHADGHAYTNGLLDYSRLENR